MAQLLTRLQPVGRRARDAVERQRLQAAPRLLQAMQPARLRQAQRQPSNTCRGHQDGCWHPLSSPPQHCPSARQRRCSPRPPHQTAPARPRSQRLRRSRRRRLTTTESAACLGDCWSLHPRTGARLVSPEPDVAVAELGADDAFLVLYSDGVSGVVSDARGGVRCLGRLYCTSPRASPSPAGRGLPVRGGRAAGRGRDGARGGEFEEFSTAKVETGGGEKVLEESVAARGLDVGAAGDVRGLLEKRRVVFAEGEGVARDERERRRVRRSQKSGGSAAAPRARPARSRAPDRTRCAR